MYFKVISGTVHGMQGVMVHVEVDASHGMPYFSMVGRPSSEVKEARERVIAALRQVGFTMPPKRITVNLSPANVKKAGSSFDFPIAVAILGSFDFFPTNQLHNAFVAGELGLEGSVHEAKGLLPMLLEARRQGVTTCFIPKANEPEVKNFSGIEIYLIENLMQIVDHLRGNCKLEPMEVTEYLPGKRPIYPDFNEIQGQSLPKRVLEIAAAGGHNVLMIGQAGCGKTMLAQCLPGILPPLSEQDYQEVLSIYSSKGMNYSGEGYPPVRNPHHTATYSALLGGGYQLSAGEISLAHKGVLLLDELPEFRRNCLDGLREPMESHSIALSRSSGQYVFPADTMIVATMNPCPCGNYPDRSKCTCSYQQRKNYLSKISQPIYERFDLVIWMNPVKEEELGASGESSEEIYKRIIYGRNRQKERYADENYCLNSRIPADKVELECRMEEEVRAFAKRIYVEKKLSMREYHHMLKVARTIADLAGSDEVEMGHLLEASAYYKKGGMDHVQ